MKHQRVTPLLKSSLLVFVLSILPVSVVFAAPEENVPDRSRCEVCGMFVAKFPNWITQVRYQDDQTFFFDGAKDMLAFYFNPSKYGGGDRESIKEIWVKDYYSLEWLDGRKAYYVVGSDVHGPMGHEFIPFVSIEAAEKFSEDHDGEEILRFQEITTEKVEARRGKHRMK